MSASDQDIIQHKCVEDMKRIDTAAASQHGAGGRFDNSQAASVLVGLNSTDKGQPAVPSTVESQPASPLRPMAAVDPSGRAQRAARRAATSELVPADYDSPAPVQSTSTEGRHVKRKRDQPDDTGRPASPLNRLSSLAADSQQERLRIDGDSVRSEHKRVRSQVDSIRTQPAGTRRRTDRSANAIQAADEPVTASSPTQTPGASRNRHTDSTASEQLARPRAEAANQPHTRQSRAAHNAENIQPDIEQPSAGVTDPGQFAQAFDTGPQQAGHHKPVRPLVRSQHGQREDLPADSPMAADIQTAAEQPPAAEPPSSSGRQSELRALPARLKGVLQNKQEGWGAQIYIRPTTVRGPTGQPFELCLKRPQLSIQALTLCATHTAVSAGSEIKSQPKLAVQRI